jgi:MFS family permease
MTSTENISALRPELTSGWSSTRRVYILLLICVVQAFNLVDRQIITILIEPIKAEFGASDTAMGLLTGLVFAGFYSAASIPIARAADLTPRRTVIALSLAFWSLMTSLGAFAQSFWQLALTRVGVAVGEAGAGPASYSMVGDLFPLRNRASAMALMAAFGSVGIGFGVFLGGWLQETFDWRTAFLLVGTPGILLAVLMRLTVREPPRGLSDPSRSSDEIPTYRQTLRTLWGLKSYRYVVLALAGCSITGYATHGWGPTFFIRVHGLTPTETGVMYGATTAGALIIGNIASGLLSDFAGRHDIRWYMWIAAAGSFLTAPFGLLFVFAPTPGLAAAGLFFQLVMVTLHIPPAQAMMQTLAPLRMRATASVMGSLTQAVVGIGIAPLLIGALNDLFAPQAGREAVRYSLALMMIGAIVGGACAVLASNSIKQDYDRGRGH